MSAENVYEFNNDDDVDFGSFPEDDSPAKARLAKRSQTVSYFFKSFIFAKVYFIKPFFQL